MNSRKRRETSSAFTFLRFRQFAVELKKLANRGKVSSSATLETLTLSRGHDNSNNRFVTRSWHQALCSSGEPGGRRGSSGGGGGGGISLFEEKIDDACRRNCSWAAATAGAALQ